MTTLQPAPDAPQTVGELVVLSVPHPQGCRSYLIADATSKQALALDPHLDAVEEMAGRAQSEGWSILYVVDSHTHADHPSGAGPLANRFSSTRVAHQKAGHAGVTRHPGDGETLRLGEHAITVRHAPGHTPDHIVLLTGAALFSGDTLLIGGVARTDFLGGDAGQLFDSLQNILGGLPDDTVLFPGHDYQGRLRSTLGEERRENPWLRIAERAEFVRQLTASPPPRPANMDDLVRLNREGVEIPSSMPAAEAARLVGAGGASSVIDVRTGAEFGGEHIPGSRSIPLDQLAARAGEVRARPAPRLLLCRTGNRAEKARQSLARLHLGGLAVIEGGIEAFRAAGGTTEVGRGVMSIERQVRIGAGSLVLLGVLLGVTVHPGFLALAAFVGAGQVVAGISDWCGMGLLLARAPWNRGVGPAGEPSGPAACAAPPPAACAATPPSGSGPGD